MKRPSKMKRAANRAAAQPAMMPGAVPAQAGAPIDIEAMVAKAKQNIPPNLAPMLDKIVLSGMRIMFDKQSHQMAMAELNKPGPMAERLSNGIIALMYMLWKQSNQTIPPQLIVPATLILSLRAFQFLQLSKDPEATPQVLGDATHDAVQGVMDRFGATQDKIPQLAKGAVAAKTGAAYGAAAAQPAPPPPGGGMLDSTQGA